MKIFYWSVFFCLLCSFGVQTWAEEDIMPSPFTEEERLKGFVYHQKYAKDFDLYRLQGVNEIKRDRYNWAKMMFQTLPDYRREKARQAAPLDETSPEYKVDRKERDDDLLQHEKSRQRYVQERDAARLKRRQTVKLTEEEEYDLLKKFERIDPKLRALYNGGNKIAKTGSSAPPPPMGGFEAPPPPPPPPGDFFEPDIPPPPPPPPMEPGSFDDAIPPPIFDEPEF